jgi:hypothetical protein
MMLFSYERSWGAGSVPKFHYPNMESCSLVRGFYYPLSRYTSQTKSAHHRRQQAKSPLDDSRHITNLNQHYEDSQSSSMNQVRDRLRYVVGTAFSHLNFGAKVRVSVSNQHLMTLPISSFEDIFFSK